MKFGTIALDEAVGAYLAHAVEAGGLRYRKGRRLTVEDVDALRAAGHGAVIAAVPESGDIGEDEAATRLSDALCLAGVERRPASTGRVNFHAAASGVFTVDKSVVDALNKVDPGLTLATLADHTAVAAGQMVATVKVIPFAVAGTGLAAAERVAGQAEVFRVHPFAARKVALVQTRLPAVKESVLDKTARITADRLRRSGSEIVREVRCAHDEMALATALADIASEAELLIVFGASAMTDRADVLPAALQRAGGVIERVGMPVDPGNLLVLGSLGTTPVIGAPGCARSPKENGFDWVLDRLLAGVPVDAAAIAGLGVGGLLMEIPTRPSPRERVVPPSSIAAIVLAAGRSSRMGGPNKLLARFGGVPLVRRTVQLSLASSATRVIVVTGHQADAISTALAGLEVEIRYNPAFADGLSTSLKTGVAAAGAMDSAMILLADMPGVGTQDIDRLIAASRAHPGAIVRAVHAGRRGNPVILPASLFGDVERLQGDTGARHLVEAADAPVVDIDIGSGAMVDVDTPEALSEAGGLL